MIYVILLEPVVGGNVGAVARAMMNFGFDKLVLINPHCDHLGNEARNRAKHAQQILEDAEVCEFFIVDDYDYLVATTAKVGTDYNLNRSPLTPAELAEKVKRLDPAKKIGLVIGRESVGMFNEEIERCDFTVTIPSDKDKPTLNLSHATAIILYELHKALVSADVRSHIRPIGKQEKDQVFRLFGEVLDRLHWETAEKRETQEKLWKRVLGKAMLTNREAYSVMGFLRKVLRNESKEGIMTKSKHSPRISSQKGSDRNEASQTKKHMTRIDPKKKKSIKPNNVPAKKTGKKQQTSSKKPVIKGPAKKGSPKPAKNNAPDNKTPARKKAPAKRSGSTKRVAKKKTPSRRAKR